MTLRQKTSAAGIVMPNGQVIDTQKPRSEGVLNEDQVKYCRANNIQLAFDPRQIGWVLAGVEDDFDYQIEQPALRSGVPGGRASTARPLVSARDATYRLRPWQRRDLSEYVHLLDDPEVWQWLPEDYPAPLTNEVAEALIELSNGSNHHQVQAVIRNDVIVGQVRLEFDVDPADSRMAEISYWLGRPFWGKGIGTDVVKLFTSQSLEANPGIETVIARVHHQNPASRRILEKAGYRQNLNLAQNPDWHILTLSRG